jgi:hypothetical protein
MDRTHKTLFEHIAVSQLSDLRLSNIPLYLTCCAGPQKADRMSHSEGLNATEIVHAYVEQQREATTTDVLLFRCWHDLATKKKEEAQKQIPTTNFFKK